MIHAARLAIRSLRRRPGFSAIAAVTIALGAGANAAVFAVAYGVLLKPLPFAEPDRLVAVWPGRFMSQVDLRYLREHARGIPGVSAVSPGWTFSLTGAGDPSKMTVDRVSGDLFRTLGATPLLGRVIRPDEDAPGAPKVLLLSHRFWRARFGGDPTVAGRTVKVDDVPHEIVGVMPPSFEILTTGVDAWAPLPADRGAFYDKLNFSLLVGRLGPGRSVEQADRDFKALMPSMRAELNYPAAFGRTARIQDLRTSMTGDMRASILVLGAAVAFMLLIAGANLGTLLVASGASRAREFAVHSALGAPRSAIVRLQLIEGLILASAGVAAGLALAAWSMPALVGLLPKDTPRAGEIRVDATVALVVLAGALLVSLLFAIVPALTRGRPAFGTLLREGASTESRLTRRTRGVMVSVEIALALVLTIGAGLMLRTLWHLQRVDPGIDVDRILTLRLQPTSSGYKAAGAVTAYYDQVLERIAAVPGVSAAGAIQHLPFSGISWVEAFELEGQPIAPGEARPTAGYKMITGDYLTAVGQRVLAGRTFTTADRTLTVPPVLLNETFAKKYLQCALSGRTPHADRSRRRRLDFDRGRRQRRAHGVARQAVGAGVLHGRVRHRYPGVDGRRPHGRRSAVCGVGGSRSRLVDRPQRADRGPAADADHGGDDARAAAAAPHAARGVRDHRPRTRRDRRLRRRRLRRDASSPRDRDSHGPWRGPHVGRALDAARVGVVRGRRGRRRHGLGIGVEPRDEGIVVRGARDGRDHLRDARARRRRPGRACELRARAARSVRESGGCATHVKRSTGPRGGPPVPSISVAPRMTSVL
ncbi:MAG TPA: ABC transporter permease [Vicinamibacterales bacterium]|nr:ABC transporter permease [Vicinamibacterales bacterium]